MSDNIEGVAQGPDCLEVVAQGLHAYPNITGVRVWKTAYGIHTISADRPAVTARIRLTKTGKRHVTISYTCDSPTPSETADRVATLLVAVTAK